MRTSCVKNGLVMVVILLFILTYVNPLVIGDNVRFKDEIQVSILEEPPEFEWTRKYGFSHSFESVVQTNDGGYIIAGDIDDKLGWLHKTDAFGRSKWSKSFGEQEDDYKSFKSVQQTIDGGFIVTGNIDYYYPTWCNIWLVKTDNYGVEEWSKVLCNGRGFSIQQTFDGGYIIGGDDYPYIPSLLVKIDSTGKIEWREKFGGEPYATIFSVVQALDGGYVATGHEVDAFVLKTDGDGKLLWKKTLRSHEYDGWGTSVKLSKDGRYIVAGFADNISINRENAFLIKIDDNGTIEWDVTVSSASLWDYSVWDVSRTSDGGYILAGFKNGGPGPIFEWYCLLIKTDSDGNKEWEKIFGKSYVHHDGFFSVIEANDGGYVAAGSLIWKMEQLQRRAILAKVAPENQVDIIKPKNALYILNIKTIPLLKPTIIGPIDIEVDTSGIEFDVDGVEFYIDGELKHTDTSPPYIWKWNKISFFKHVLEAVAFSIDGERGGRTLMVRKFF